MKVSELEGALLDYWVAMADESWKWAHELFPTMTLDPTFKGMALVFDEENKLKRCLLVPNNPMRQDHQHFAPSTAWEHGGPIIERDQIFLNPPSEVHYNGGPNNGWKRYDHWRATVSARTRTLPPQNETQQAMGVRPVGRGSGATALIAAMRAKVASHYGAEVPEVVHG
ncbi:phage protein NinX family protein [Cupriavidus sp. Marseille-Q8015]